MYQIFNILSKDFNRTTIHLNLLIVLLLSLVHIPSANLHTSFCTNVYRFHVLCILQSYNGCLLSLMDIFY